MVGLAAGIARPAVAQPFRGKDMIEVIRFLEFVANCEPGLSP